MSANTPNSARILKKLGLPDNFPVGELSTIENLVSYMVTPEAWKHSGEMFSGNHTGQTESSLRSFQDTV